MISRPYSVVVTDRDLYEHGVNFLDEQGLLLWNRSGAASVLSGSCRTRRSDTLYATEIQIVFEARYWTGREPRSGRFDRRLGPVRLMILDAGCWQLWIGPLLWTRVGACSIFDLGRFSFRKVGRLWAWGADGGVPQ